MWRAPDVYLPEADVAVMRRALDLVGTSSQSARTDPRARTSSSDPPRPGPERGPAASVGPLDDVGRDIPVGAVVTDASGAVIAEAVNRRRGGTDPTAHAEVVVLRLAGERLGSWRLDGCSLFATLEPCPMCAGAAVSARVRRIVFGAWNPDYGACGSLFDIPRDRRLRHRPEVVAGVLADECAEVVRAFFADRRAASREVDP